MAFVSMIELVAHSLSQQVLVLIVLTRPITFRFVLGDIVKGQICFSLLQAVRIEHSIKPVHVRVCPL